MTRGNFYKPRYKIAFQAKSVTWIYRNSRLRNIYDIRRRLLIKNGYYRRKLAVNRRKWLSNRYLLAKNRIFSKTPFKNLTVNKRFIRRQGRYKWPYFKNLFILKQQIKKFYGHMREYHMRRLFRKIWKKKNNFKQNIFFLNWECRVDVILYRLHFLPTIYSSYQLIRHGGVLVNNRKINYPHCVLNPGDILSVPPKYWVIFISYIFLKLERRKFLKERLLVRKIKRLRKFYYIHRSARRSYKKKMYYHFNGVWKMLRTLIVLITRLDNIMYKIPKIFLKYIKIEHKDLFSEIRCYLYEQALPLLSSIRDSVGLYAFRRPRLISYQRFYTRFTEWLYYIYEAYSIIGISIRSIFRVILIQLYIYMFKKRKKREKITINYTNKNIYPVMDAKDYKDSIRNFLAVLGQFEKIQESSSVALNQRIRRFFFFSLFMTRKNNISYFKLHPFRVRSKNRKARRRFIRRMRKRINRKKARFKARGERIRKYRKNFYYKRCFYIPEYLEVDFSTLRVGVVYAPQKNQIFYGFNGSLYDLLFFYKSRGL